MLFSQLGKQQTSPLFDHWLLILLAPPTPLVCVDTRQVAVGAGVVVGCSTTMIMSPLDLHFSMPPVDEAQLIQIKKSDEKESDSVED